MRTKVRRRGVAAALIVTASLVLAGCTTDQNGAEVSSAPVSYPLDHYRLNQAEHDLVGRATYTLVRTCVRRQGLELPPLGDSGRVARHDRYGLADEGEARSWAYQLDKPSVRAPKWFAEIAPRSRLDTVVTGLGPDGRPTKRKGVPPGGCSGEAQRVLTRGVSSLSDTRVTALERLAWETSRDDPRVKRAARKWDGCVEAAGYSYRDPVGAPFAHWGAKRAERTANRTGPASRQRVRPDRDEIAAALTDVRCKRTSGLLATWSAVDASRQRELVDRHRRELDGHRRQLDAQLANARRVLDRR